MPVNLSIKDVPDHVAAALRARAERNHRSLQGELMAIVAQAAAEAATTIGAEPASIVPPAKPPSLRRGSRTIEQIAAEHRARYPEPFARVPRAVDLIREDRDTR